MGQHHRPAGGRSVEPAEAQVSYFSFHYPVHLLYSRVPPAVRRRFTELFGLDLHDYWDLGLDIGKFDDEFVGSRDGQSVGDVLTQAYGPEVCAWVKGLISGVY